MDKTSAKPDYEAIDQCLPQWQCGQCGFVDCQTYAQALSHGHASINQCLPGGSKVVSALAKLLKQPEPKRVRQPQPKRVAAIDWQTCIGCHFCVQVCPVQAIVGSKGWQHQVMESWCTGCELCAQPCPVDCIRFIPVRSHEGADSSEPVSTAAQYRQRYQRKNKAMSQSATTPAQLSLTRANRELKAILQRVRSRENT